MSLKKIYSNFISIITIYMAYRSYRSRRAMRPSRSRRGRVNPPLRRSPIYRSRARGGVALVGTIPRLLNRQTHYFKRIGAQFPLTMQYTGIHPATAAGLVIACPAVLDQGGAAILGFNMASSQSTTPINLGTGGSIYGGSSVLPNTQSFGFSLSFNLRQAMEHLDFTTLFDKYKLLGVKVDLQWHSNNANIGSASVFPTLYQVFDGDDATIPTNKTTLMKQEGSKQKVLSRAGKYTFYCKPRQLLTVSSSSSGVTSQQTITAKWINCADAGVNHYGMKFFVDDITYINGAYNLLQIQPTYYLALKDTQ